eukprot:TRINITY_DN952_c1_g1_i1.p1 TRINITY_DN952_c1_g1~~TRINITY_DN952_c1_g1_i1.p1  ORF type:complete len:110 (-),score=5.60 TRINITY_DN952_c1_g1_i1:31-360(-)
MLYHRIIGNIIYKYVNTHVGPPRFSNNTLGWILTTLFLWRTHVAILHRKGWSNVQSYFFFYLNYTVFLGIDRDPTIMKFLDCLEEIITDFGETLCTGVALLTADDDRVC